MKLLVTGILFVVITVPTAVAQQTPGERIERLQNDVRRSMLLVESPPFPCESPEVEVRASRVEQTVSVIHLKGSVQIKTGGVVVSADEADCERYGSVIRLKGNVQVKTDAVSVSADQADYHRVSGEIRPRGNVQIRIPLPVTK